MKRSEVREFIRKGVEALSPQVQFGDGRLSEFNSKLNKELPFIWMESLSVSTALTEGVTLPYDSWSIVLHIAKQDKLDSLASQYEAIIDECDLLAQELITQYNFIVAGYKTTTMEDISREPFIKNFTGPLTGVILSFTLTSPDTTDTCPT